MSRHTRRPGRGDCQQLTCIWLRSGCDALSEQRPDSGLSANTSEPVAQKWQAPCDTCVKCVADPASWERTNNSVAALLGDTDTSQRLVGFLNLSLNYLPALEALDESQHLKQLLYSYGRRLSSGLGFDHDLLLGVPGIDWTLNARAFKHIAYDQNS